MKAPNYYLSEMNVSSKHGGGLTFMRVLGEDLEHFERFISPVQYPVKGFETIPHVTERELNLWKEPGDFVQRPMPRRFSRDYVSNQIKRALRLPNPKYINWDYYRKFYTEHLHRTIDLENGRFLVVPQDVHSVVLSNHLFKISRIPYATWIMDDNMLRFNADDRSFEYPYPQNYEREFEFHLQNAKHVFVISENMGRFYKNRFGIEYSVCFSPSGPPSVVQSEKNIGETIRLCHFGRIWKWPLDAVESFAERLEEVNATLDIFSHFPLEGSLLQNNRVQVKEPVDASMVGQAMVGYDAVTVFYGFKDEVRQWSEFNISTKMSECLASGLPSVFVGPQWGAMSDWAKKHGCGILIDDPASPSQMQQITRLRDANFKRTEVKKCLDASAKYTSVNAMKQVWKEGWSKV